MSSPLDERKSSGDADGNQSNGIQTAAPSQSESAERPSDQSQLDEDDDPASMYEDEEGGYRVGDIFIPPPIKPYCSSESHGSRLIITHIMNKNFKSYAGDVMLGPFCQCFQAIVGPNGSGKSNVIDSMLFVFGYRSNKIRCKKLSLMIHKSKKFPNIDSCSVAVHFARIEDRSDGTYQTVEGSAFFITRVVHQNNSSYYTINDRRVQFKDVAILLKKYNVDLDYNRFLILQGEVESIAMMKPKAQNENESGFLEYLEDIIGTKRYKEPLQKISTRVDVMTEERDEKHNRCKLTERELNDLKEPMEEAVAYLKLENDLARTKNKETQIHIYNTQVSLEKCEVDLEEKAKDLKEHDMKYEAIIAERREKEEGIKAEMAVYEQILKKKEDHEQMKKNADRKYDEVHSSMEATNDRRKQIIEMVKKKEAELEELKRVPAKNEKEILDCEKKAERFTHERDEAKDLLQRNFLKLQDEIKPLTEKKHQLEEELANVQLAQDQAKADLDVSENELKLVQQTESTERRKYEMYEESLKNAKETLERRREELTEGEKVIPGIRDDIAKCEQEIHAFKTEENKLKIEVANLRSLIEGKSHTIQQARSNNKVLEYLMQKKIQGELPGVLGRLGDLGGIDNKYDVAISTCCGRLDNIVVDTVETAEKCINSLKADNIGRAAFIALEKIEHYAEHAGPIQTPENASRLYDLVRIEDERLASAFYFALRDTLVANDMDQATRIAYGTKRYRVVTLKGEVIETSGTMSGGGGRQFRGKMGEQVKTKTATSHNTSVGNNTTIDDLDQLRAKVQDIANGINYAQQMQGEKGKTLAELKAKLPKEEANLKRFKTDITAYAQQIPGLETQLEDQRKIMEETRSDEKRVADLNSEIAERKKVFDKCQGDTKILQDQVDAVNQEIETMTEDQIGAVEKSVQNLEKQIKKLSNQVTKLKVETEASERNVKNAEENIATMKEDIDNAQNDLRRMHEERAQAGNDAAEIDERLQNIIKQLSETRNGSSDATKEVIALQKQESDAKLQRVELEQTVKKFEKTVRDMKASIPYYKKRLEPLKLHKLPNEDTPQPLKTYTNEELATYSIDEIQYRVEVIEGELKSKTLNINVIDEYQKKLDVYMERIKVLEDITTKRNEMRKLLDDVKKRRYNEFMSGFNIITHKLKEMYTMITQGGSAELELVDSMDPFSEGISFSVRPNRKSWKNISNLSGGEKTLASLALVFALHYYKPSPLYFMDEIDAALDFKNVSIVANYIKERTKNAQFIIISLRSNMFELADYLTGIYKIDDCTDAITIENAVPPLPIPSGSQAIPSSQFSTIDSAVPSQSMFMSQNTLQSQQKPEQSSASFSGNDTTEDEINNSIQQDEDQDGDQGQEDK
ncbi:structural maintenance of chromosomes protein 4 [Contarinia nasturtii]|uniref:structural maintenance of chromosomes protein 4 n=1 Tax=Contarinia nasturtii TaxID=265458 RepID=UPI0012D409BF|nr:structural maintenance of chromosomes protein 4 [Contarinia nasturtii]